MKILVATVKPFAPAAIEKIKSIVEDKGYELALLEKYTDKSQLLKAVEDADALIIRSDKITNEVMNAAKNLKIVVRAGAGYDNVDLDSARAKDIVVMNTPGQNSNAVAELALGMMVYLARNKFNGTAGIELKDKKIGIHAYGNVGKNVARIAKGFDMDVFAYDPFVANEDIEADEVTPLDTVEELYSTCDYVSLHIPANKHTIKSIDYDLLKNMPKGGTLVNTARKEVVDEEGLFKLMEERDDIKYISDIAPDMREQFEDRFGDRVFFTPKKMGAQTAEANINAGVAAAKQIIRFFEEGDVTFKVN
ncbi:MAG TPA: 3-phosphoglycerate dehydrogenase [Bacteroidetes bacterium]|nr:3-phosphoglycerate dehydrogenase [Bacteroidota bacterium]